MASEIRYFGRAAQTGDTLTAQLYDNLGAVSGGAITMTEVASTFVWEGDMTGVSAGSYGVRILDGTTVVSQGTMNWSGELEVTIHHLGRLIANRRQTNPSTGKEQLFDDDDATVLLDGDLYEDIAGSTAYSASSEGADRRDRLQTP